MERGISELFLQRPSLGRDPVSEQPQESPPPGLRRPRCDTRGSGALYSSCRKPRASGKPSGARVGGGPAGGKGARARGAGAGRRKGRAARPRRPPCSGVRAPAPAARPAPPVTPGGRCSRDRSQPHPAPPLPRLQPPPAELHYARQFRHFAKTKTRGRRKRRARRKRRR